MGFRQYDCGSYESIDRSLKPHKPPTLTLNQPQRCQFVLETRTKRPCGGNPSTERKAERPRFDASIKSFPKSPPAERPTRHDDYPPLHPITSSAVILTLSTSCNTYRPPGHLSGSLSTFITIDKWISAVHCEGNC